MRIAHVTDFYLPRRGGVELHVQDLAHGQLGQGHEVDVFTATPGEPGPYRLATEGRLPGVRRDVRAGLRAALAEGGYDVVHAHIGGPLSPLAFAAAALGEERPTVMTVHSMAGPAEPLLRAADAVTGWSSWPVLWTAVSAVAAEPVERLVAPAPVLVLPNGIDAAAWRVRPRARDPRDVLAVAVMRFAYRKRPLPLLRVLRQARRQCPPDVRLRLAIVGDGPLRSRAEKYVRRHGLGDSVEFLGWRPRPDVGRVLARADVFLAPAALESFGIAALEARCAGVPVLSRLGGGTAEFVEHGRGGLLVSGDAEMAEALALLAADPVRRAEMAAHNRNTAPAQDWPAVLTRTQDIYALAGAGAGAGRLVTA